MQHSLTVCFVVLCVSTAQSKPAKTDNFLKNIPASSFSTFEENIPAKYPSAEIPDGDKTTNFKIEIFPNENQPNSNLNDEGPIISHHIAKRAPEKPPSANLLAGVLKFESPLEENNNAWDSTIEKYLNEKSELDRPLTSPKKAANERYSKISNPTDKINEKKPHAHSSMDEKVGFGSTFGLRGHGSKDQNSRITNPSYLNCLGECNERDLNGDCQEDLECLSQLQK